MPSRTVMGAARFPHTFSCGRVRSRENRSTRMTFPSAQCRSAVAKGRTLNSVIPGTLRALRPPYRQMYTSVRGTEKKGPRSILTTPVSVNNGRLYFCRWRIILGSETRTAAWKPWCQGWNLGNLNPECSATL